jgi:hypothetical protein
VKSSAMLQRIAALESKLKGSLAARAHKAKLTTAIRSKKKLRSAGTPTGPNRLQRPQVLGGQKLGHGGSLSLGSTATSRFKQTIEEDEYIAEINGSVGFAATAFNINPGQSGTFPWGNKIAQLYERYDFKFLEFYICSEVSAYAAQGQTGVVMMSCDYDASDAAPTTKQQVLDTNPHTVPCLPSVERPIVLRLDCREMRTSDAKYVRPGSQPANTDLKTYDAGILYVSTQGNANTTNIGELHVRYRCELRKPVLESAINLQGAAQHWSSIVATSANNFASAVLQAGGSPVLAGITLGANSVVFPAGIPGNYFLVCSVAGATSASAAYWSGGTALNILSQSAVRDAVAVQYSLAGTTTDPAMSIYTITVPVGGATVTWNPSTIVGTGTMDLFIFALPTTLLSASARLTAEEKLVVMYDRLSALGMLDDGFVPLHDVVDVDGVRPKSLLSSSSSSSSSRWFMK